MGRTNKKMLSNTYIYALKEPATNRVRYVGKTIQKPESRLASHISVAKHGRKKDYAHCWIKSILSRGEKPILEIIESGVTVEREIFWIKHFRKSGVLTNFTDGGELGNTGKTWKLSKETIDRTSSRRRKKVYMLSPDGLCVKEIDSVMEFKKQYNLNIGSSNPIKKGYLMSDGLIPSYSKSLPLNTRKRRYREVLLINGVTSEFKNVTLAANYLGVDVSTLCKRLKPTGETRYPNYLVKYKDNDICLQSAH